MRTNDTAPRHNAWRRRRLRDPDLRLPRRDAVLWLRNRSDAQETAGGGASQPRLGQGNGDAQEFCDESISKPRLDQGNGYGQETAGRGGSEPRLDQVNGYAQESYDGWTS